MTLPPQLLARARVARRGLEVGAGREFSTSLELARAAPQAQWWVSDIHARVLEAPPPLRALVLDVNAPDVEALAGVDLVLAVRVPEELQVPIARLARALRADLAMRALKDEWAESPLLARYETWGEGWRSVSVPTRA